MIYRCTPGFIHWHWIWKRKSKHILNAFVPMGGRFMGTKMYKVTLVWEPVGPVGYQTNPERRHWSLPFFEWFGFYATWGLLWFTVVYQLLSSHPESKFPTLGCGDPCLGGGPGYAFGRFNLVKIADPAVLDVFWCFWYLFLIRFSRDTRYTMVYRKQKASDPWLIHLIPRSRQSTYGFQKLACEYFAKGAWEQHQRLGGVGRRFPLKSGLCHQIAVLIGEMLKNWWIWRVPGYPVFRQNHVVMCLDQNDHIRLLYTGLWTFPLKGLLLWKLPRVHTCTT